MFLKAIFCRHCDRLFFVCQSCWRGQAYCSDTCRNIAYRKAKQRRQKRYRQTDNGREKHRCDQRKRRLRQSKKTVGDAASNFISPVLSSSQNSSLFPPCCHFCGARGVLVDEFSRRSYGARRFLVPDKQKILSGGRYDHKKNTRQSSGP